jgi:hypothetical protein
MAKRPLSNKQAGKENADCGLWLQRFCWNRIHLPAFYKTGAWQC